MIGTFDKSESIGQVYIGQNYKSAWSYNYIAINANYTKGQTLNLKFNIQAGSLQGSYLEQITVHQMNSASYVSCWQFSYQI